MKKFYKFKSREEKKNIRDGTFTSTSDYNQYINNYNSANNRDTANDNDDGDVNKW